MTNVTQLEITLVTLPVVLRIWMQEHMFYVQS